MRTVMRIDMRALTTRRGRPDTGLAAQPGRVCACACVCAAFTHCMLGLLKDALMMAGPCSLSSLMIDSWTLGVHVACERTQCDHEHS